ncbi:hypothetical protein K439DRAFT_1538752 [Ramaria rubella]|nr:hypothetical protein K439DRAFT_1538752 [Ramaria rubella]
MFCQVCSSDASQVCSKCKHTHYCSAKCQKADWKIHKKGCEMQQFLKTLIDKVDEEPPEPPANSSCTGCNVEFDGEDYECDQESPDCGYQTCESCTCYCPKSNFGNPYCDREPRDYHGNGRNGKTYKGDRHPEAYDAPYPDSCYEAEPRACNNCGVVTRVFKKEYCSPWN